MRKEGDHFQSIVQCLFHQGLHIIDDHIIYMCHEMIIQQHHRFKCCSTYCTVILDRLFVFLLLFLFGSCLSSAFPLAIARGRGRCGWCGIISIISI